MSECTGHAEATREPPETSGVAETRGVEAAVLWTPLRAAHRTWNTGRPVFHKLPHPSLSRFCATELDGHNPGKRTFLLWRKTGHCYFGPTVCRSLPFPSTGRPRLLPTSFAKHPCSGRGTSQVSRLPYIFQIVPAAPLAPETVRRRDRKVRPLYVEPADAGDYGPFLQFAGIKISQSLRSQRTGHLRIRGFQALSDCATCACTSNSIQCAASSRAWYRWMFRMVKSGSGGGATRRPESLADRPSVLTLTPNPPGWRPASKPELVMVATTVLLDIHSASTPSCIAPSDIVMFALSCTS